MDDHTEVDDFLLKDRPRILLAACDEYIEPAIKFSQCVHRSASTNWQQLVLLRGETFPFRARPSTILVSGMPAGVIASVPALEEWGIASRLASPADLPGCYDGEVAELAALWLKSLSSAVRAELQVVTIGPVPGMQAAAAESNVVVHSVATTPTLPRPSQS